MLILAEFLKMALSADAARRQSRQRAKSDGARCNFSGSSFGGRPPDIKQDYHVMHLGFQREIAKTTLTVGRASAPKC